MYYLGLAVMLFPVGAILLLVATVAAMLFVAAYGAYDRLVGTTGRKKGFSLKPAESK